MSSLSGVSQRFDLSTPPTEGTTTNSNKIIRAQTFTKFACHTCFKRETLTKWKLCNRCKIVRYCSEECQKADWNDKIDPTSKRVVQIGHKNLCSKVQTVRTEEEIEKKRKEVFESISFDNATTVEPTAFFEISKQLHLYKNTYRFYLTEEMLGAKILNKLEESERARSLLILSYREPFITKYPIEDSISDLNILQQNFTILKNFSSRIDPEMYRGTVFEDLEFSKSSGTRYLEKGFSAEMETAFESLRKKVIELLSSQPLELNGPHCLLLWVYTYASTRFDYLLKDKHAPFVQAAMQNNVKDMLECIDWLVFLKTICTPSIIANFASVFPDINQERFEKRIVEFNQRAKYRGFSKNLPKLIIAEISMRLNENLYLTGLSVDRSKLMSPFAIFLHPTQHITMCLVSHLFAQ